MTTEHNLCLTRCEFVALFAVIALLVFVGFYNAGQDAMMMILTMEME